MACGATQACETKAEDEVAWSGVIGQVEVVKVGKCSHVHTQTDVGEEGRGNTQRHKACWETEFIIVADLLW